MEGTIAPGASRGLSLPAADEGGLRIPDRSVEDDQQLSARERARFGTLYREQYESVLRLLRGRVDNEQDAADLAQEAFLRVLRYRHCGADSLRYLLFRVAMNLAVSHVRLVRTRCDVHLGDWDFVATGPSVDEQLAHEQQMALVMDAVQALPEGCRQSFSLSRFEGLRQRDIAQRCGISTRMVEYHIARAQVLIRERVGPSA